MRASIISNRTAWGMDEEEEEIECSLPQLSRAPHHLGYEVQQYLF